MLCSLGVCAHNLHWLYSCCHHPDAAVGLPKNCFLVCVSSLGMRLFTWESSWPVSGLHHGASKLSNQSQHLYK